MIQFQKALILLFFLNFTTILSQNQYKIFGHRGCRGIYPENTLNGFKKAIELYATAIILCHNHPSGKLQPSNADKLITSKLKNAGETLDIKVLDHLIITENAYFSFADENLM